MNHTQALAPTPRDRCLTVVLQFLKDSGLTDTLDCLQQESRREWTEPLEGDEDALVTALMSHDERRNAFKKAATTEADALVDRAINALKLSQDRAALHSALTLTPHAANITTVKFQPSASSSLLASGGVDKTVYITDVSTGETRNVIAVTAPVLSLDWNRGGNDGLLLIGCMNGEVLLTDIARSPPVLQRCRDHSKYVIAVKFAPDGRMFASASHDGIVCIYLLDAAQTAVSVTSASLPAADSDTEAASTASSPPFALHHRLEYRNAVESAVWLSSSLLLVAPREDNYLHIVSAAARTEHQRVNMNLTGDDHVSFSAMHCALSPDGSLLAVATDQHRLLILAASSPIQVRNYWGLQNDGYSTPRLCWSKEGRFVYVSQQDASVCCYDVSEGRAVGVLRGHEVNVRDVDCHPFQDLLATASFDRTIRVWKAD